jgi:protease-4
MGSDTIAQAFRDAVDDPDVAAIIFRVSSPGGSYLASDQIWREVQLARKAGKPVVATMGATAASGGYFVAMAADKVLAQPGTITGSIGVLGGKMVTADLLSKLGITLGEISVGNNALIGSSLREYTPEQWKWINRSLDRVYQDFTRKAAKARGLNAEQIDRAARGRIWTGADALQIGLVDMVGGFVDAVDQAKELAGIDSSAPVKLLQFPKSKTFSEQLLTLAAGLNGIEDAATLVATVTRNPYVRETLAPMARASSGVLTMPPLYQLP